MRFPIDDETEIIVKFNSRKEHERFCHETGAGSRFIYRETDSGRIQVLCRLDRRITKYGEQISDPMWLENNGKPARSVRLTSLERSLLEAR
jgi:hypothetical protein